MGLELPVAPAARMPQLTVVSVPNGVDEAAVRRHLLAAHRLEIGGGLGAAKGKVWRVGLMGAAATRENVTCFLSALDEALRAAGYTPTADPIRAAEACWR